MPPPLTRRKMTDLPTLYNYAVKFFEMGMAPSQDRMIKMIAQILKENHIV